MPRVTPTETGSCTRRFLDLQTSAVQVAWDTPTLHYRSTVARDCFFQIVVVISLVLAHVFATFLAPVHGCPTGYLGPGGLHDGARHFNCTGGAAGFIDRRLFGDHMYTHPTSQKVYDSSVPYDPEGVLGSLTSIFLVYLGIVAGKTILIYPDPKQRIIRWAVWAVTLGLAAGALCGFAKEGGIIPVNKNLWSLSYVLTSGSFAFSLFLLLYLLIDVCDVWSGSPFFYAGMNSIVLYVGHELCEGYFPLDWVPFTPGHAELLLMNTWATMCWMLVSFGLYKSNFFLSV